MIGFVYVMANAAMPGMVKIGRTNDLYRRADELSNTSVPHPFEVVGAVATTQPELLEARAHAHFANRRASYRREFFCVSPDEALAAVRNIAITLAAVIDMPPRSRGFWAACDRFCDRLNLAGVVLLFLALLAAPFVIIVGGLILSGLWDAIVGRLAG